MKDEDDKIRSGVNSIHGFSGTKFYNLWCGFKQRCDNSNEPCYKHYGGRGIVYSEKWKKFENFKYDMYKSYLEHKKNNKSTTLERIDTNGNYCKKNCKWATYYEQNKNTRRSDYSHVTFNGKTQLLSEWAREMGLPRSTLESRLNKKTLGWEIEKAMTMPSR